MRLRYTASALVDLASILDYIAFHSPQGARRVQARIQRLVDLLTSHPHVGRETRNPKIRRLNTSPYPYLIFYEIAGDEIIIHAIRHGARDPSGVPEAT